MKDKVQIKCPIHGIFEQTPDHHLQGNSCPKCSQERINKQNKSNKREFIEKSHIIHKNKYDYKLVIYSRSNEKVKIICPIHGIFNQSPNSHLSKHGCPNCSIDAKRILYSMGKEKFINKSKKIHQNYYKYDQVNYKNNNTKVCIICPKHGCFTQVPASHLAGNGCPKCSNIISNPETEFLNEIGIKIRNYRLPEWKFKSVDGYDPSTKTVYEFLGDYWHGNPKKYKLDDLQHRRKVTFQTLLNETFNGFKKMKSFGYNVKYIWEMDWKSWDKTSPLPIESY
jgi:hypothetical protein